MTTPFQARQDLCKAWGFASVWHARDAMLGALDGSPLPPTAALGFSDKAGYLAARQEWRARQRTIEAQIRALKAARRTGDTIEARGEADSEARTWAVLAHAALMERALQKIEAGRQWRLAQDQAA